MERFAVDDHDQALHAADSSIAVPAGHNHFQFDYAGLSFVAPQKVRYRFMLEGFDHNWTEAGSRRIAYYTNIPPGHYTFRVQAANNDGVWNMEGASLAFELAAAFLPDGLVLCGAGAVRGGANHAAAPAAAAARGAGIPRGAGGAQPHSARDSRHAGAGLRGHLGAA